jgi:hypothetical protein
MDTFIFWFLAKLPLWTQFIIVIIIISWFLSREQRLRILEKYKQHDSYTSEKQRESYQWFIDIFFRMTQGNKIGKPLKSWELEAFMIKFHQNVLLYGSPEIIKAMNSFTKTSQWESSARDILICMENIVKAMRIEMGLSNTWLSQWELVQVFITDDVSIILKQK